MLNSFIRRVSLGAALAAALLFATPSVGVADGPAKGDPVIKKAQSAVKKKLKSHIKFMKSKEGMGQVLQSVCAALDAIAKDLASGATTPQDAAIDIADAWEDFVDDALDLADIVLDTGRGDTLDVIEENSLDPADSRYGLLPGQCGLWDMFYKDVQAELDKATAKALKKVKKAQKAAAKANAGNVNVAVAGPAAPAVVAPVPIPAPPPPKAFKMDTKASAATRGEADTGIICVGGQADPGGANQIEVKILDASGQQVGLTQTVNIDGNCRWRACFPTSVPGTLPSGVYRIEATQTTGGAATAADFTVPSTD